jgi:hypothetical protein
MHAQKTVLEATALQVGFEFLLHVVRQRPALPGQCATSDRLLY